MLIGEGTKKLSKLMDSGYIDYETSEEIILLNGAPPEIVELYEWYMSIREEEKRTGANIF